MQSHSVFHSNSRAINRSGRAIPWTFAVLLLFMAAPAPALGQSLNRGAVEGTVVSSDGAPVANSRLMLAHEASGVSRSTRTPIDGSFSFGLLPTGEYALRIEQLGYRPQVIEGIIVRAGQRVELEPTLSPVAQEVERVDTVFARGSLLAGRGASSRVELETRQILAYPYEQREVIDLARFGSIAGPGLEMEGLPSSFSGVRVDGMSVRTLDSPSLRPGTPRTAALPLTMFDEATLVVTNPDVEWSHVGGSLDATTTRGPLEAGIHTWGSWSGDALRSSAPGVALAEVPEIAGGFRIGGSVLPGEASFVVGVEAWRLPAPTLSAAGGVRETIDILQQTYGANEGVDPAPSDVFSTYGRFAWQISENADFDAWASLAIMPSGSGRLGLHDGAGGTPEYEGRDLLAGATWTTRFSEAVFQEVRFGLSGVSRTYDAVDGLGLNGRVRVLAGREILGSDGFRPDELENSSLRASETIHIGAGNHRIKFGLGASFARSEVGRDAGTEAIFSDAADLALGNGYLVRAEAVSGSPSFTIPQAALFLQDRWTAVAGLDILLGLRFDLEKLPTDEVQANAEWLALSGLDNTNVDDTWWRASPRLGFTWDVQDRHEWLITGSAGLFSGASDPVLIGDWIAGGPGIPVSRGFGSLENSPLEFAAEDPPASGRALMLLDPNFQAPRTLRTEFGISRLMGANTALHLAGVYRHTDFLTRFSDLNLAISPQREDQYGRPIFGDLRQRGGLLYAEAGSNRRFSSFDQVIAIGVDGWSTYQGVTAALEHRSTGFLDWFASYTYSQTTDNWGAESGTLMNPVASPGLSGADLDWLEGRSDFDVPHRAVVGTRLEADLLSGLEFGILYRFRSGHPFTPRFRSGVDANADGSLENDVAFVDPSLTGMTALIEEWECLQGQSGRFAERNACRTDPIHTVDARLALGLVRFGRYSAELVLDGLNLLGSEMHYPDATLLLVDPTRSIAAAEAGTLTLPLVANDHFGMPLFNLLPERLFRLGFRLSY